MPCLRLTKTLNVGNDAVQVDLPTPAILKPVELWSGKQLFSVLVRPNAKCRVFVNLELNEKNYTKKNKHMCHADGCGRFQTLA